MWYIRHLLFTYISFLWDHNHIKLNAPRLTHDISKNLQEGQQTDILILDFAKAFDKVNHSLLIHKLQHYGIIGKSVRWIQNWLANRKQSVVIDGSTSDAVSVDSGVPQGSVLGPGLFLYYINDLQSRLTSTVRLFADDTIPYLTISNNNDAETLQKDLDKLGHWENEWCMKFHPGTLINAQYSE